MKNFLKFLLVSVFVLSFVTTNAQTPVQPGDVDPQGDNSCLDLTISLRYKDTDAKTDGQVSQLQDFLVAQGYITGNPTGYFGLVTLGGVKKFQSKYGFSPTGFVGPLTKAKIKEISCNTATTYPNNPSDRANSNNNLPTGCTSTSGYSPVTGERCILKNQDDNNYNINQKLPYISLVSGKAAGNFEIDAGSSAYISGNNLGNVSVSVGGKLATVTQTGDSFIYATMPGDLVPGQTYDLFVYRGLSGLMSNVVKVKVLSRVLSSNPSITVLSPNGGELIKGNNTRISWSGGVYPVQVGVVKENWPNDTTVVGWINTQANANSYIDWDTNRIGSADYLTSGKFSNITPGRYKVVVAWGGQAKDCISEVGPCIYNGSYDVSDSYFTITSPTTSIQPSIASLSVISSRPGTVITIYGTNFSTSVNNIVTFLDATHDSGVSGVTSTDGKTVTFTVPDITPGNYSILVENILGQQSNRVLFTVVAPSITTAYPARVSLITPTHAIALGSVLVNGGDFNTSGANDVMLKNVSTGIITTLKVNTASSVSLTFQVPQGMATGEYALTINNNLGTTSSTPVAFWIDTTPIIPVLPPMTTLDTPTITSIAPSSAKAGSSITVRGSNFNTSTMNLLVFKNLSIGNSVTASSIASDKNTLTVNVPSNLSAGQYEVFLGNGSSNLSSNTYRFTVEAPSNTTTVWPVNIALISPSHAKVGDQVTVTGLDFNVNANNTVSLTGTLNGGSASIPVKTSSPVQITFTVPSLPVGEYVMRINNNKGVGDSNFVAFWVEPTSTAGTQSTSNTLVASLTPAVEDHAGMWNVFGPGKGYSNQDPADWVWIATLNLSSAKTISSVKMDHTGKSEHWSTDGASDYPLVLIENNVQSNSTLGQQISLTAGSHTFKVYGQKESTSFGGSTMTVNFTDGTSVRATIGGTTSFNAGQNMTANMFDALKSINPNLYR
jgi:peptidoglycan hydrolase-like protein with peptidoglycan-binding domain